MTSSTTVSPTEAEIDLIAPIEAYLARAANRPIDTPVDEQFAKLAVQIEADGPPLFRALPVTTTFWCDISEFQPYLTSAYPYPVISMRADSGWRTDNKFAQNWKVAKASTKIQIVIVYVVCIPGQLNAVLTRVKSVLGAKCPPKVAFMIDMESGAGFAGRGNHSAEGNAWLRAFGNYAGSNKRSVAYANGYDFQQCWPQLASGFKKVVANYSSQAPNGTFWGWQYAGGDPRWPSAAGYPRAAQPFGSYVDFNVAFRTVAQMKTDLGIGTPPAPAPKPGPAPSYTTYKVKSGDSLIAIANKYKTTWQQLVQWNKAKYPAILVHPSIIQIGWVLRVSK